MALGPVVCARTHLNPPKTTAIYLFININQPTPPPTNPNPTQERARARRIFAEAEILYRLSQLARQHPGIVRPDMVNRWTQGGFDGRFSSDAAFVNADPRVRFAAQQAAYGSSSYGSASGERYGRSFGGGSSSGGRGGQW